MCGIAGICKWERHSPAPAGALDAMLAAIRHRGPDGEGVWVSEPPKGGTPTNWVALLHSRLAVIDLPGGAQPMGNEAEGGAGEVRVVFNGEIYNHLELRAELERAGHRFKTDHSDTEVLVHGWEEWGVELPRKLVGMFAFAIWDSKGETLFLCRDRMGQKPLFYATLEDGIVFGSTIPSVLAWPEVPRRVPMEQIGLYLMLGYFPGPQSVWRDVSRVLPGGWVRVRRDVVDGGVYWPPPPKSPPESARLQATSRHEMPSSAEKMESSPLETLRKTVSEAVFSQLVSDVPVACFLSGGIDSSIIAAVMQEEMKRRGGESIRTVSVGFRESGFDETEYARAVAEKIGSRHLRVEVDARADVFGVIEMLMGQCFGEPFADSSILPTYHLSKAAREVATVALSGDGADELFGGYDRYRAMMMMERWGGSGRLLAHLVPRSLGAGGNREKYRRFVAAARAGIMSERYTRLVEIFPMGLAEEILGGEIMDWFPLPEEYGLGEDVSALRFSMRRDEQEYLPGDVLWKVDSGSMSPTLGGNVGPLEVRSPFLDHRVVEVANGLADSDYVRGGVGKFILREAFGDVLPAVVKGRGKKGFGVPVGEWFRGELRSGVMDLLFARDSFCSLHLKKGVVERMVGEHVRGEREHTHRVFALVMLEMWWRRFLPSIETGG